jgi:hypothetical protein
VDDSAYRPKEAVAVVGNEAVQEIGYRLQPEKMYEAVQQPAALQVGQKRKKCIQSFSDASIPADKEGGVRTAWNVTLSKAPSSFVTLIRHKPHRGSSVLWGDALDALFGGYAKPAVSIIDQRAFLSALRQTCSTVSHAVRSISLHGIFLPNKPQLSSGGRGAIVISMLVRFIQGLLVLLAVVSGAWRFLMPGDPQRQNPESWVWIGFLIGLPILLAALMSFDLRWTGMVVVMYATIGLALDIATLVQEISKPDGKAQIVMAGLLSGAINFLLVVCGGQAVLGGRSAQPLRVSRRPNPPSPFSS